MTTLDYLMAGMQVFFLLLMFVMGCVVGRRSEHERPSATDEELIRWIVQRRMERGLHKKFEEQYRAQVEQEITRRQARGDWTGP